MSAATPQDEIATLRLALAEARRERDEIDAAFRREEHMAELRRQAVVRLRGQANAAQRERDEYKRLAFGCDERVRAAESRAAALEEAVRRATVCLEILHGRNAGCQEERREHGMDPGHGVSAIEVPGWIEELRALTPSARSAPADLSRYGSGAPGRPQASTAGTLLAAPLGKAD